MIIRAAQRKDARVLAQVHITTWKHTYAGLISAEYLDKMNVESSSLRWEEYLTAERDVVLVADEAHQIIGFVSAGYERSGDLDFEGELSGLYVLPECQGQQLGTRLIKKICPLLTRRGIYDLVVWVLKTNRRASRYYQHLGGRWITERTTCIGKEELLKTAYGWRDIQLLDDRCSALLSR